MTSTNADHILQPDSHSYRNTMVAHTHPIPVN